MSFTSLDALSDRLQVITSAPSPPDPRSTIYTSDTTETVTDDSSADKLKDVRTLLGMHLIIREKQPDGRPDKFYEGLYPKAESLDPGEIPKRKRELVIICDTLELESPIWVPETRVTIYARLLVFKPSTYIKTTPLPWTRGKEKARSASELAQEKGGDGKDGRHAGPISVWVEKVDFVDNKDGHRLFRACGADGQHAGEGKDGEDGHSVAGTYGASGGLFTEKNYDVEVWVPIGKNPRSYFRMKFDPPALFAHLEVKQGEYLNFDDLNFGTKDWPTSGTAALPPGRPGDSGSGGLFTTSYDGFEGRIDNRNGQAGNAAPGKTGGKAGTPTADCRHYELVGYVNLIRTVDATIEYKDKKNPKGLPKKGADGPAPSFTPTDKGRDAGVSTHEVPGAWVHPLQLQNMLTYVRDAYLAEQRVEVRTLLESYSAALLSDEKPPLTLPKSPWHKANENQWLTARCEVAGLLRRLDARLDYFGNPAGYMPLLSLQASLERYSMKIETALRALLLSEWVRQKQNDLSVQSAAANATIKLLIDDTDAMSKGLGDARDTAEQLMKELREINAEQETVNADIAHERTRLEQDATNDEKKKALWKAGVNAASALLHVFPYGQPVTGKVGDMAASVGEKLIDGEGAADIASSAGDKFGNVVSAHEKAATEAVKQAEQAAKDDETRAKRDGKKFSNEDYDKALAGSKADVSRLAVTVHGIGPALSRVGKAISVLQVPESKIQARLEALQKESDKFKDLAGKLSALIEKKGRFAAKLTKAMSEIGDNHSRMAANARGIGVMEKRAAASTARLDPEALLFVGRLDQQARTSLIAAIYMMVKSYETTLFKPIEAVHWRLDRILDEIRKIVNDPGKAQSAANLLAEAKVLQVIFEQELDRIRDDLIKHYQFGGVNEQKLGYAVSAAKLERLKDSEVVVIDPVRKGLNLENRERAFLYDVELEKDLEFEGTLPRTGNVEIKLKVSDKGIVRVGGKLFAVRRDAPVEWSWIYDFAGRTLHPSKPSVQSESLLNWVFSSKHETSERVGQLKARLSLPPAWSNLLLRVSYPRLDGKSLKLTKLRFTFHIDSLSADDDDRVLELRCDDPSYPLKYSPADRGGHEHGSGQIYGVYRKGTMVEVGLDQSRRGTPDRPMFMSVGWKVPDNATVQVAKDGNRWEEELGQKIEVQGEPKRFVFAPRIRIKMDRHMKVRCITRHVDEAAD